jgi:hypothetical protein
VAVKGGEARRGQRLVHRRPHLDPRIAIGDPCGEIGELVREIGIEQLGVARPRTMVEESSDDPDPALAKHRQPLVRPGEVQLVGPVGGDRFPEDRVANRLDPEAGDQVDVAPTLEVAGLRALVSKLVAEANDGAFDPSPKLKWSRIALFVRHPN